MATWILYTAGAAVALAAADVFVKLAAGRLPNSLGMLLYGSMAFGIGLMWFLMDRQGAPPARVPASAFIYALAVGVAFSAVTIGLYGAFRAGAPLSVVSPAVRLGGLLIASLCGLLIWNEPLTFRYGIGLAMATAGVYLIVTR